jgi:hypothetical protein
VLIPPPPALVDALRPWSDFYGHSPLAQTVIVFLHVGGLLLGGGLAVATDRATLRALALTLDERASHRGELAAVHRWVVSGIALIAVSGVALVLSDIETFWGSPIYWTKMGLVVALLVNGFVMTRAETTLVHDDSTTAAGWRTLHRTAIASLGLWFLITALGIALVNFS